MDLKARTELQDHLDPDENFIWTGQPKKGIVFRTADLFLIPFSLIVVSGLWCFGYYQ
jgi:hypothetical protein